jgi:hypothetical protein
MLWKKVIIEYFDQDGDECEATVGRAGEFVVIDLGTDCQMSLLAGEAAALAEAITAYANQIIEDQGEAE